MDGSVFPIEFWFDFSSPYAYFAAHSIDEIAQRHGRTLVWRPFLLGVAFRATGMMPLIQIPLRGNYARHDWERLARFMNVPFHLPEKHPIAALAASRMFYWIEQQDGARAAEFAKRVFHAYFAEGIDISDVEDVAEIGVGCGFERADLVAAAADAAMKERLRAVTDEALGRGIFGSPFVIVDGEPFWGVDRLSVVDEWLRRGGW
ncbi:MAG TPA: 2-hydroxychromene-2-carboxylate isomerase [Herpetosiphonaceae bacterium]|nr:2-hydroxychromene-2-carboxylate isomerase [Herpetosiphonaceae bacterium]